MNPGNCWAHALFGTPCYGAFDNHHLIKLQWLRRERVPMDAWHDHRILRPVCRVHHQMMHSASFHLWKHQLPQTVLVFAREKGLEHLIDQADERRRETDGTEDRRVA